MSNKAQITRIGHFEDGNPVNFAFDCHDTDSSEFSRPDSQPHIFGWTYAELEALARTI